LTKQNYEELNALLDEYGGDDACSLKVIAFPSGQFKNEEPASDDEFLNLLKYVRPGNDFVANRYLDFSKKIDVNGDTETELYAWLKDMCPRPTRIIATTPYISWRPIKSTDIKWNFEKWLLDHEGMPRKRYTNDAFPNDLLTHILQLKDKCNNTFKEKLKDVLAANK
jgi:glutathione peroxidase